MSQGTHNSAVNPLGVPVVLDLDAELDEMDLSPVPFKLGGKTYHLRRDLTGKEMAEYFKLSGEGQDVEALSLLIAKPSPKTAAVTLNKTLEGLAQPRMHRAVRKIMAAAGLITESGEQGESLAS